MNISSQTHAQLSPLQITQYKQRLVAMVEVFDADLCCCLVRQAQSWCVVGLEGELAREYGPERLPTGIIEKTLSEEKGLLLLDVLFEPEMKALALALVVSSASVLLQDGTVIFVASKRISNGVYTESDLESLEKFVEAFETAHRAS